MPVAPDRSSWHMFIWITTCILFICILAGGGCLVEYMVLPESKIPSWMPLLGFILVSLPWAFWLLTFLYRIFSRCCGCRIAFDVERDGLKVGGGGGGGGGGGAVASGDADAKANVNGINRTLSVASHESQIPLAKSLSSSSNSN